jgi:hypothetical protein
VQQRRAKWTWLSVALSAYGKYFSKFAALEILQKKPKYIGNIHRFLDKTKLLL